LRAFFKEDIMAVKPPPEHEPAAAAYLKHRKELVAKMVKDVLEVRLDDNRVEITVDLENSKIILESKHASLKNVGDLAKIAYHQLDEWRLEPMKDPDVVQMRFANREEIEFSKEAMQKVISTVSFEHRGQARASRGNFGMTL